MVRRDGHSLNIYTQMANGRQAGATSSHTMAGPLYQDISGYKGCCSKTNRMSCLVADGLSARYKDQSLTDKKLSWQLIIVAEGHMEER